MSMYFITKTESETGKKFQSINEKMKVVRDAQKALAEEYGFEAWRKAHWCAAGGMSSCLRFTETPSPKIWGKGDGPGEFFPKKNSKEGKIIWEKISELPKVEIEELNMCIGFDEYIWKTIGYSGNNEEYFGFSVGDDWGAKIPEDCEEVTTSKYRELFNDKTE